MKRIIDIDKPTFDDIIATNSIKGHFGRVDWCIRNSKPYEERPHEWIPVSERLPDDMQRVLVWFEYYRYGDYNCMYQTYGFGYVCDGEWSPFINGETGWKDARIIAWMPLPESYKEVENDTP